jgi:uncharacterized membrane protein
MTYGAGYPATEERALPAVVYALYILGLFHGLTLFIGLIMAYVLRGGAGAVNQSHYTYLIRTFWISLIWMVIGAGVVLVGLPFTIVIVGIPVVIAGGIICTLAWVYAMVRSIIGAVRLAEGQPISRPEAYGL